MTFTPLDWVIIVIFLIVTLGVGLFFKGKAEQGLSGFFLGGRNLPWYIAGISMVATTFAADTPLWVTEQIKTKGISGNWLWWNMVIGGVLTTFFFARLWRRANVITELEFIEKRYGGKAATWLRAFKSVYLGIFMNAIIIGWVNAAMIKILTVFFDLDYNTAILCVTSLMVLVAIYSSISGLLGVAFTDAIQFTLAMGGCIILAYIMLNSEQIGGMVGLKEKLAGESWRLDFFPKVGETVATGQYSITITAFLAFLGVQWWASWYPGAEPGGGGYVAQRMMSAKDEKNAVYATLFFQVAHYCFRPWPWIIVGLCCVVVYPDLSDAQAGEGFVMAMKDFMPSGLKGLLFAAFLGAYMSTISTQLNWGAGYLTNDLYPILFKNSKTDDKSVIKIARISTVIIMIVAACVTPLIQTIDQAARFLIGAGAGMGLVLILRWYWWRVNVWSEISATIAPIFGFAFCKFYLSNVDIMGQEFVDSFIVNEGTLLITTLITTIVWLIVTFMTQPESKETLVSFYNLIQPDGAWEPVRIQANKPKRKSKMIGLVVAWLSATLMVYSLLFTIGKFLFLDYQQAAIWLATGVFALIVFLGTLKKIEFFKA